MNDEKGKGRANDLNDSDKPPVNERTLHSSSSFLERVKASATGLAQSALAAPSSNELSDTASSALISAGKGRRAGVSSSSWAESSWPDQQSGLSTSQGQSHPSIRTGHREEHIIDTEADFSSFLDGIDSFKPSSVPYNKVDPLSTRQELDILPKRANGITYTRRDQAGEVYYNSVDEQQQHDGDAVLSILSYPSATADDLEALYVAENFDWNLTDQQISQLRALVDELFPPPEQIMSVYVEHPLNLVPNMVSTSTTSDPVPSMDMAPAESYLYFGNIPRSGARQLWMEQWEDVLTRYTDEVWGNLLPLVVEAREEVKAIKENHSGTTIEQSKALRRLRLVLDHVRKL